MGRYSINGASYAQRDSYMHWSSLHCNCSVQFYMSLLKKKTYTQNKVILAMLDLHISDYNLEITEFGDNRKQNYSNYLK